MPRTARTATRWAFAAAVAASLGFGATQALARPATACYDNGSTVLGACSSSTQCTDRCRLADPEAVGRCNSGCCFCL
ncbi:MAG TPA: hypothetical protein VF615_09560 [Longimicrobiaceae bacterium]|jgi:hypothetical protein